MARTAALHTDPQRQTFIDGTSLACRASLCSTAAMSALIVCWKIGERQTLFRHTLASVLWAPCVKSLLIIWRRVKGGMRDARRTRVRERGGGVFRLPCPVLSFSTHICSLTCIADVGETSGVSWDIWLWSIRGQNRSRGRGEHLPRLYGLMGHLMAKDLAGWTLFCFVFLL